MPGLAAGLVRIATVHCWSLQVHLLDQVKGTAELHLKAPLNCEEKKSYQFDIQALSCTGAYSERYVLTFLLTYPHSRFEHYFCSNLYGRGPRCARGVKKSDFFYK